MVYKHGESLFKSVFETNKTYPIILVSVLFATYAGMFTSSAYTIPMFLPFAALLPLLYSVTLSKLGRGVRYIMFWMLSFILAISIFTIKDEPTVQQTIINSRKYTNNKFKWIRSKKNYMKYSSYYSHYIREFLLIILASLVSGGTIGLLIVTVDISKIIYCLMLLILNADKPLIPILIGIEVWNVIRFISYAYIIIALAPFFWYYIMDFEKDKRQILKYLFIGIVLFFTSLLVRVVLVHPTHYLLQKSAQNLPINMLPGEKETTDFKFY